MYMGRILVLELTMEVCREVVCREVSRKVIVVTRTENVKSG